MTHTFLLEPGVWLLQGNWLERGAMPITFKGKIMVTWGRDEWFNMVMRLAFTNDDREPIDFQYRGRLDVTDPRRYTYVLQHSEFGRAEGEGWLSTDSIIQHYRAIGDRARRSGFETLYRIHETQYQMSGAVQSGHYLSTTFEATVERQE